MAAIKMNKNPILGFPYWIWKTNILKAFKKAGILLFQGSCTESSPLFSLFSSWYFLGFKPLSSNLCYGSELSLPGTYLQLCSFFSSRCKPTGFQVLSLTACHSPEPWSECAVRDGREGGCRGAGLHAHGVNHKWALPMLTAFHIHVAS